MFFSFLVVYFIICVSWCIVMVDGLIIFKCVCFLVCGVNVGIVFFLNFFLLVVSVCYEFLLLLCCVWYFFWFFVFIFGVGNVREGVGFDWGCGFLEVVVKGVFNLMD